MKFGLVAYLLLIVFLMLALGVTTEGFANPQKRVSKIAQKQIKMAPKKK